MNVILVELVLTFNHESIVLSKEVVQGFGKELRSKHISLPLFHLFKSSQNFEGIQLNFVGHTRNLDNLKSAAFHLSLQLIDLISDLRSIREDPRNRLKLILSQIIPYNMKASLNFVCIVKCQEVRTLHLFSSFILNVYRAPKLLIASVGFFLIATYLNIEE